MTRIALTGGIACGKSLVAKYLNELGIATIDADDVVHEILPDPEERRRIAAEVFGNEAKRRELEAKIHPLVKERILDWSRTRTQNSDIRVAIIPLLFETHWDADYDIICCVRSAREKQIARMMETRAYTREEAEARLAAQMPVEEKAGKSHYVINNNGSAEELKAEVKKFVSWLTSSMCLQGR